jgi:hypothetical protein
VAACTNHQEHFISLFGKWYALVVYCSQCLKTQSSSQMQIFFPSSSVSLLASYTALLIYNPRMHPVAVHPATVVNGLQHFSEKNLL